MRCRCEGAAVSVWLVAMAEAFVNKAVEFGAPYDWAHMDEEERGQVIQCMAAAAAANARIEDDIKRGP